MTWLEKARIILHLLRWRLTWSRYAVGYRPSGTSAPRFLTAREAARQIPDGARVFSCGIAGNARCSVFFFALRDRFRREGHPRDMVWINGGAQGSRGRVPGTVEELALPGLLRMYLAAHLESARGQLRLAEAGKLEVHTLPQGIIARLLEEFARGKGHLLSEIGIDTFLDPRSGRGSAVTAGATNAFVAAHHARLRYTMPRPDVALFNAPYADRAGNLYFHDAATLTENLPALRAVRKHGGKVMVTVSRLIPTSPEQISVPAGQVDHIVVNPYNEQVASVRQRRPWILFTPRFEGDPERAMARLKFINNRLGITPRRRAVDRLMSRVAASLFVRLAAPGSLVNIGVGLPEEVVRVLLEEGLADPYTFTTEAGSFGGLPAPGVFFGAAIQPRHLEDSSRMFERYRNELDLAVLGFLELDVEGNVNASRRSSGVANYVGPGGFPDITHGARNILFIGSWMKKAEVELADGQVGIRRPGSPKCVDSMQEVTFSAKTARASGKRVFYITDVGVFRLGPAGLELILQYPGIRLEEDLLANATAPLNLLPAPNLPRLSTAVARGTGLIDPLPIAGLEPAG